jgi:putative hemolysin
MMPALKLLGTFKQSGRHVALVLDEYGGISGLVTLHDVLEGVVGDLPAADEEGDQRVVRRPNGSWLLDGMLRLDELRDVLDLTALPDDAENFNTLAGLILARIGHLPKVGEVVEWSGFRFEVVDLDGHRIDRVLVMPPSKPQERDVPRTT